MALPNGAGGYQVGSGNLNEVILGYSAVPQTASATATLTAAQITGGLLVSSAGAAAVYTLPTAAQIDAVVTSAHIGSTFDLAIVAGGAGGVTLVLGAGITDGGNALTAVATVTSGIFRFRKDAASTWVLYRLA